MVNKYKKYAAALYRESEWKQTESKRKLKVTIKYGLILPPKENILKNR